MTTARLHLRQKLPMTSSTPGIPHAPGMADFLKFGTEEMVWFAEWGRRSRRETGVLATPDVPQPPNMYGGLL